MFKSLRSISLVAVASLAIAVGGFVSYDAFAQDTGSGLRVSPTRTDISVVPGASKQIKQTVKNVTGNAVKVEASLSDFESDGVSGEPVLITDGETSSSRSMKEFVELPEGFELEPEEEKEITLDIKVPDSASPGAYYGSVLYKASPANTPGDGQVVLVASVGSLVLVEVPGDITEKIEVKSIGAYIGEDAGTLFTKKPDNVGILVENQGNGFAAPFGKVKVTDWRGNEVFEYDLNNVTPRKVVLPESKRLYLDELNDIEVKSVNGEEVTDRTSPLTMPGRYTISGNISHGKGGEILPVKATFWYIPMWLVIVLLVGLIALMLASYGLYKKNFTQSTKRKSSKR